MANWGPDQTFQVYGNMGDMSGDGNEQDLNALNDNANQGGVKM
jgi:hypothetical protein